MHAHPIHQVNLSKGPTDAGWPRKGSSHRGSQQHTRLPDQRRRIPGWVGAWPLWEPGKCGMDDRLGLGMGHSMSIGGVFFPIQWSPALGHPHQADASFGTQRNNLTSQLVSYKAVLWQNLSISVYVVTLKPLVFLLLHCTLINSSFRMLYNIVRNWHLVGLVLCPSL